MCARGPGTHICTQVLHQMGHSRRRSYISQLPTSQLVTHFPGAAIKGEAWKGRTAGIRGPRCCLKKGPAGGPIPSVKVNLDSGSCL